MLANSCGAARTADGVDTKHPTNLVTVEKTVAIEDYNKATVTCAYVWTAFLNNVKVSCAANLNNSSDEKLNHVYADVFV